MSGAYHLILTARILAIFQLVVMYVRNRNLGVYNIALDFGNNRVST